MLRAGGSDTRAITVRHLLMHAGGLADHAESPAYLAAVLDDPAPVRTRTGQIAAMLALGPSRSEPGAGFACSDAGDVLLGDIVERATGMPLGAAMRALLRRDTPGRSNVRWDREPPGPGSDRAHQWLDGIDTTRIHGSVDAFGGGGIVARIEEAARLHAALVCGATCDRPETLDLMLTAPGRPAHSPCRMGLFAGGAASGSIATGASEGCTRPSASIAR